MVVVGFMQALVRQPPKPHEEMKVGKKAKKKAAKKRPFEIPSGIPITLRAQWQTDAADWKSR